MANLASLPALWRKRPDFALAALLFLALLCAFSVQFPALFSGRVMGNLLIDSAPLGFLAIGAGLIILSGGIDLSIAAVMALCALVLAKMMVFGPFVAFSSALLVGLGFGLLNGMAVNLLAAPPFIITLTTMFLARGVAILVSQESVAITDASFSALASWKWQIGGGFSLSAPALLMVVGFTIAALAARHSHFGRNIYALGYNEANARLLGTQVPQTKLVLYMLSGLCAACAGICYALYTSSGNALAAIGGELDAIAAVVVGGVALSGGRGSLWGVFFGLMVMALINTYITFVGTLSSWWGKMIIGALLLTFLIVQRLLSGQKPAHMQ